MSTSKVNGDALKLHESIELREGGGLDADGTVLLHVLRPRIGRGRGTHLYEASMLEKNAHKFKGWKMYTDHLSEAALRALQGLPRPVAHSGGRVLESWWDKDVPAEPERGYGQGAVVARVRPVLVAKEIIEQDPGLIEASINARATSIRKVNYQGRQVNLVEGIRDTGTIDWVTDGGAGGRVASLVESAYHRARDEEMAVLDTLTDEELVRHLRENRPGLVEALTEGREGGDGEGGDGEGEGGGEPSNGHSDTPDVAAALREALESGDIAEAIKQQVDAQTAELREELEMARADAEANTSRAFHLRKLRESAHERIRGAKLTPRCEADLLDRYELTESGEPTAALDVLDELDEEGKVVKPAADRLAESIDADIKREREKLAEAAPTRVRGQGSRPPAGEDGDSGADAPPPPAEWEDVLSEAGIEDPRDAYETTKRPRKAEEE